FQVQSTATNLYAWPLVLRACELTPDGFGNRFLFPSGGLFIGRNALPGFLTAAGFNTAGRFTFTLTGDAGAAYAIETSIDLLHWTTITTLQNSSGAVSFVDPDSANSPQRFYRGRPIVVPGF